MAGTLNTPAWPGGGGTSGSGGFSGGSGGLGGTSGSGTGGSDDPPCGDPIHGCFNAGEDIGDIDNNAITNYPEVKYPKDSNYEQKYPKLTEYLKNQLPKLKDNLTIINAIVKYGDLSAAEVKDDLQWGKGPTIKIVQLDIYKGCDETCLGQYSSYDPNTLLIDQDLVDDLEATTPGSKLANSFSFLVGVTVLHEYVHFSEWIDNAWNSSESGVLFENDVYGQTVWRNNAKLILKNN